MNKQKKILLGIILVVVVLMAIGYAAVQNITLTINGSASASASQDNFKVFFTGANTVKSDETNITVDATQGSISADVTISGLTTAEQTSYAILEIKNGSNGVNASEVKVTTDAVDTEVFDISAEMCDSKGVAISDDYSVASGATTYVKVSAKLLKTPTVDTSTNIKVTLTATPETVQ